MEAKRFHGIRSHLEMTWAIRTTEHRNHRDGIPCQSFPEYQIQHIPPFWNFGFGTFRFILQASVPPRGSISYLNMWVHPSEMVIALHSLLGCHRSPNPFKGCTRRFQCHCPERLVPPNCQQQMMDAQGIMHKKWSGWKVKNNKIHMTVLWGSFWLIPSIIFIHSFQLCSIQYHSMNFIVSQSTTTLHSHGCFFSPSAPQQGPRWCWRWAAESSEVEKCYPSEVAFSFQTNLSNGRRMSLWKWGIKWFVNGLLP